MVSISLLSVKRDAIYHSAGNGPFNGINDSVMAGHEIHDESSQVAHDLGRLDVDEILPMFLSLLERKETHVWLLLAGDSNMRFITNRIFDALSTWGLRQRPEQPIDSCDSFDVGCTTQSSISREECKKSGWRTCEEWLQLEGKCGGQGVNSSFHVQAECGYRHTWGDQNYYLTLQDQFKYHGWSSDSKVMKANVNNSSKSLSRHSWQSVHGSVPKSTVTLSFRFVAGAEEVPRILNFTDTQYGIHVASMPSIYESRVPDLVWFSHGLWNSSNFADCGIDLSGLSRFNSSPVVVTTNWFASIESVLIPGLVTMGIPYFWQTNPAKVIFVIVMDIVLLHLEWLQGPS